MFENRDNNLITNLAGLEVILRKLFCVMQGGI